MRQEVDVILPVLFITQVKLNAVTKLEMERVYSNSNNESCVQRHCSM